MINTIKQEYQKLPRRDQKAIYWGLRIFGTELSKMIILLLFFLPFHKIPEFLFCALSLYPVRSNMGGLHFKTYQGCLFVSILLFAAAVFVLPASLPLTRYEGLLLLLICMLVNLFTRPVINPTRPALTKEKIAQTKRRIGVFFTAYIIAAYLFYNHYFLCGTWMVAEQTLQLMVASMKERGAKR